MAIKSLIINPGSTSTKLAVFEDETLVFDETLRHSTQELAGFEHIFDQKDFRKKMILNFLSEKKVDIHSFDVVVGRGGLLKPIPGGTYAVTDALLADLKIGVQGEHASNLGGAIAREIGDEIGVPSYIVDPVVVDELTDIARLSGVPECPRVSIFHPLNQKAVARRYAKEQGKKYEDLNLIVCHLGGGVSCGIHDHGRIVDVYGAFNGDGCFSPERANGLPPLSLVKLCFCGKYSQQEVTKKIIGGGGFNAYLGTNDAREIFQRIENGDDYAKTVMDAFIYQLCKNIAANASVVKGRVDQILVTGGIAYQPKVIEAIRDRVDWIAPVTAYPGEEEMLALAQGALRVMRGEEKVQEY